MNTLPLHLQSKINKQKKQDRPYESSGGFFPAVRGSLPKDGDLEVQENSYLDLDNEPGILEATIQATRNYGSEVQRSEAYQQGTQSPTSVLEAMFARVSGLDHGILTKDGYSANTILMRAIGDGAPVYMDSDTHTSLRDPAKDVTDILSTEAEMRRKFDGLNLTEYQITEMTNRLNKGKSPLVFFNHNDIDDLNYKIKKYGPGLIVTEEVFSVHGDNAPIADIAQIVRDSGSQLLLDLAHSFGLFGKPGKMGGLAVEQGIDEIHYKTLSLSKAIGKHGGAIGIYNGAEGKLAEMVRRSNPLVFSTSPSKVNAASTIAAMNIMHEVDCFSVREKAQKVREQMWEKGIPVRVGDSGIVFMEIGKKAETVAFRNQLEENGLFGSIYLPPATDPRRCGIRFNIRRTIPDVNLSQIAEVSSFVGNLPEFRNIRGKWNTSKCGS